MNSRRYIHIVCAVATAIVVAGCADGASPPTAPSSVQQSPESMGVAISTPAPTGTVSPTSGPAPSRSTANFEIDFMTDMIDHHQMAVETAEICVDKAVHRELRAMCRDIIAAQSAEIQQMQTWLQQWYGVTYQPRMGAGDQKMLERLASMSGADFEIAFMEMMITHHEAAIKEAQQCLDKAGHAELRQLCENIIATQSAEVQQLKTWLCQWYGEC